MTRWKRQERETAALLGSIRNPNTGASRADIDAGIPFAVQQKTRMSLPAWFTDAVAQAKRDATAGKTPVVVFTLVRQGVKAQRFVVLDMDAWLDLHGPAGTEGA